MQARQNFDTHQVIKSFIKSGFNEDQAEVIMSAIIQSKDYDLSKLVTKEQFDIATLATKEQLKALSQETKEQINALSQETKEQINALSQETKGQINALAQDVLLLKQYIIQVEKNAATKEGLESVRRDFREETSKLEVAISKQESTIIKWVIGSLIAISGIIIAAMKFLH